MTTSFGSFLKEKRQEKNLTQKELAQLLFVSESAVSKWETDASHPDITLLPKLSSVLGVTEHELITASIDTATRTERHEAKKWRAVSLSWQLFFYIGYGIALLTCFICNLAVNKTLSWFWIVFASLFLSFTFTSLPKFIKKFRLVLIPASMYGALCLLLGVCAIYTHGDWFFIATVAILVGLIPIFFPIFVAKYDVFLPIRKYNDYATILLSYVSVNVLLMIINAYTGGSWYVRYGLTISTASYACLLLLVSVRFLRVNRLFKTSIVLLLSDILAFVPPMLIRVENPSAQYEIDDLNILKANLSVWSGAHSIERNISLIIALSLLAVALGFLIAGTVLHLVRKKKSNKKL